MIMAKTPIIAGSTTGAAKMNAAYPAGRTPACRMPMSTGMAE